MTMWGRKRRYFFGRLNIIRNVLRFFFFVILLYLSRTIHKIIIGRRKKNLAFRPKLKKARARSVVILTMVQVPPIDKFSYQLLICAELKKWIAELVFRYVSVGVARFQDSQPNGTE